RRYSIARYRKLINKAMKACQTPDSLPASLSTDIIVGFPGETKKQFQNTSKLFKDLKFDLAYISQYSPRPGTIAAKREDNVPKSEKKRREEELMKILRHTALANNKKYVGRVVKVLVEGKTKKGQFYGKTETYKVVKFSPTRDKDLTGHFVPVKITKARDFGLDGKIV
ncbi:MAG: TRAM domain-containing protein, partial [Patescibacteria group bacterium]